MRIMIAILLLISAIHAHDVQAAPVVTHTSQPPKPDTSLMDRLERERQQMIEMQRHNEQMDAMHRIERKVDGGHVGIDFEAIFDAFKRQDEPQQVTIPEMPYIAPAPAPEISLENTLILCLEGHLSGSQCDTARACANGESRYGCPPTVVAQQERDIETVWAICRNGKTPECLRAREIYDSKHLNTPTEPQEQQR